MGIIIWDSPCLGKIMNSMNELWWYKKALPTRCRKALIAIERINRPEFRNDSPDDLKKILDSGRLTMLRNVGQGTADELRALLVK